MHRRGWVRCADHYSFHICAGNTSHTPSRLGSDLHGEWLGYPGGTVLRIFGSTLVAKGCGDDQGSTLVEMAISSSLFLAALFGIIQVCWAIYAYNFVNEAAREAARYAIVRGATYTGTNCTSPGFATCVAQAGATGDIAQYVQNLAYPGIDPSQITTTTTWPSTVSPSTCPSTAPCNGPGNLVQVIVSYPFSFHIPFVPNASFTMASTSQLVISQ